jgi:hypothetical protein
MQRIKKIGIGPFITMKGLKMGLRWLRWQDNTWTFAGAFAIRLKEEPWNFSDIPTITSGIK